MDAISLPVGFHVLLVLSMEKSCAVGGDHAAIKY